MVASNCALVEYPRVESALVINQPRYTSQLHRYLGTMVTSGLICHLMVLATRTVRFTLCALCAPIISVFLVHRDFYARRFFRFVEQRDASCQVSIVGISIWRGANRVHLMPGVYERRSRSVLQRPARSAVRQPNP
ncbi:hypothetical protein K466DRAFT_233360 [Polyporus arcularius HHB13444]|uniref:Uncharacterized protein n=1 Tax=Polyporus arcularius HHB13444 TaxID=1314778 RepID=A0A5C3P7K7_9APHY|nr:hypothetical protein K466DRAFT_233360 [Polyporus arcularius HHB13444]